MASGVATVKAVLSGDSLVLVGGAKAGGPPPELVLTLASLQAPRLARSSEASSEPFAFASREFLRSLTIGKQVRFKVEYRVPAINRDFGSVWLPANARGVEENACVVVARSGWAKVKNPADYGNSSGACEDIEKMLAVEQVAIAEKKGMYADADERANLTPKFATSDDGPEIYGQFKGKLVPAVIENVRDGAAMRALLVPTMQVVNFGLAGVQCPRVNAQAPAAAGAATQQQEITTTTTTTNADGSTTTTTTTTTVTATATTTAEAAPAVAGPAPFAREAKHFTEMRLLNRDVQLKLEGVDKYGNLYGSVVHKSGHNISVELLKNGLARMVDWSAAFASSAERAAMRAAEKEAKLAKLRVWHDYQPPKLSVAGDAHLRAVVVEVISGDCLVVVADKSTEEKRIYLSSLRAPRLGNARRNEPNAPYALEAKEYLRNRAISKNVRVEIEYEKPNPANSGGADGVMTFASIFLDPTAAALKKNPEAKGANVAVDIVAAGLAEVVRHRPDEPKSEYYDDLVTAETKAQTQKKGLHSTKAAPPTERRVTDLCFDSTKAKQYLPFLTREKNARAVVEHVYSGSRVKLFIPKENCVLNFVIAGIKVPQPARYGAMGVVTAPAEPLGEVSKLFTKRAVMQRDVIVEIEDMDRGGNAFGALYVGGAKDEKHNFGVQIVREGLAWVDAFSAERTATGPALSRAQDEAQAAKKNYWTLKTSAPAKSPAPAQPTETTLASVKLSEIVDGTHFFLQNTADRTCAALEEQMAAFTRTHGTTGKTFEVRRNAVCAALFDDGRGLLWNRARVEQVMGQQVRVRFIDYGNETTVPVSKLRPLDATVLQYPPQAKECVFAFIKPLPATHEFGADAAHMLGDVAWGKTLSARVLGTDDQRRQQVALFLPNKESVAAKLVTAGLLRTDRKAVAAARTDSAKQTVETLTAAQETAKRQRLCLWQYGDIESDDE